MKYIYKIQNLINNKVYIGQTKNFKVRFKHHKTCGKQDSDYPLYHEIFVYGIEKFDFSIIETIDDIYADDRERYWISYYNSFNEGYNQQTGGINGFTFSEKSKQKISESNRGKQTWLGKHHSAETKKKISEINKNPSEETRQKMRDAKKNYVPWNKGNKTDKDNWNHCWVVNENGDTTRILVTELQKYIDLGYQKGRKYKKCQVF